MQSRNRINNNEDAQRRGSIKASFWKSKFTLVVPRSVSTNLIDFRNANCLKFEKGAFWVAVRH